MKQDRFLIGILIGIAVIVVIALAVFFTRTGQETYQDEAAPEGVVNNYVLALFNRDYPKAYGYLADLDHKPTQDQFRQALLNGMVSPDNAGLEIGETVISGDEAVVYLNVVFNASDPFSNAYRNPDRAVLIRQDGAWKISYMPYSFWAYDWYQPTAEPGKP